MWPTSWRFSCLTMSPHILQKWFLFFSSSAWNYQRSFRHSCSLHPRNTTFSFLKPFKQAAKPIPRHVLAVAMRKNVELTRFVVNLLPNSYGGDSNVKTIRTAHRTLLAFNLATLLEFIPLVDNDGLVAGTMSFLLPALLTPLKISSNEEGAISAALRKDGTVSKS